MVRRAPPCGRSSSLSLSPLLVLLAVSVLLSTAPLVVTAADTAGSSNTNSTNESRGYMDKAANAELVLTGLNTLQTSCNGACGANAPCVLVGSTAAAANRINCVNETRCFTFNTGRAGLCMEPFPADATTWNFYPASTNDSVGISPFERVGLVQPSASVQNVVFRRANDEFGPLATALDLSSFSLVPSGTVESVTLDSLQLSGLDNAATVTTALGINIVNCNLVTIPTQFILGDGLRTVDLSNNAIKSAQEIRAAIFPALHTINLQNNQLAEMDITAATFPSLQVLKLDGNDLKTVPDFLFDVPTLTNVTLTRNPSLNASSLTETQFAVLSQLAEFLVDGVTPTAACPPQEVILRLNSSFTFCVGLDSGSVSGSGSGTAVGDVELTPAPVATVANTTSNGSDSKVGLIVGIIVGVLAVLAIVAFVYWWCVRRRDRHRDTEPHKPTFTSMGSFIGGGGVGKHHHSMVDDLVQDAGHYDAFVPLRSNASSEQSSADSYPILGNIAADGPDGLHRLSYQDLYLHKLLRVSSRSELWLGEYFDEDVVVKKIKVNTVSRTVMRDFVEEVRLISSLKHARIVEFRGALWDKSGTELCAVVEFMHNGPLRTVTNSTKAKLTVPKQHAIGRQVAEALAFLHSQQIVHGRLNSFNILLDSEYEAKLSVFSIFHYVRLSPLDYECAVFVAPEVQRGQQPTEKADVYAFGVVLVELDAGESPEQNRRRRLSLQDSSPEANSPTAQRTGFSLSSQCSSTMKDLITACVERDPARRPSMAQISMALRTGEIVM